MDKILQAAIGIILMAFWAIVNTLTFATYIQFTANLSLIIGIFFICSAFSTKRIVITDDKPYK